MVTKKKNSGQFKRGQSGNPGGKPKGYKHYCDLFRNLTPKAIALIEQFLDDETAKPELRLAAAREVLDRGWGRPAPAIEAPEGAVSVGEILIVRDPKAVKG